jgi:hypothetical protein
MSKELSSDWQRSEPDAGIVNFYQTKVSVARVGYET